MNMENDEELQLMYDETNDDFSDRESDEYPDHVIHFAAKQEQQEMEERTFAAKIIIVFLAAVAVVFYLCWMAYK